MFTYFIPFFGKRLKYVFVCFSGILSGYVFQLTFFVGWLTIDARRYFKQKYICMHIFHVNHRTFENILVWHVN